MEICHSDPQSCQRKPGIIVAYFYQSFTELLHAVIDVVVGCRLCAVLPTIYLCFQLLLTPSIICNRSPVASPRSPTFPPIHVSTLFAQSITPINNDPKMDRGKGGSQEVNGVTYLTSLVLLKHCSGDPSPSSTRYNNWIYMHVVKIL